MFGSVQGSAQVLAPPPQYPGLACAGCAFCVPNITLNTSSSDSIMDILDANVCHELMS
jgi:hypothetical protein